MTLRGARTQVLGAPGLPHAPRASRARTAPALTARRDRAAHSAEAADFGRLIRGLSGAGELLCRQFQIRMAHAGAVFPNSVGCNKVRWAIPSNAVSRRRGCGRDRLHRGAPAMRLTRRWGT